MSEKIKLNIPCESSTGPYFLRKISNISDCCQLQIWVPLLELSINEILPRTYLNILLPSWDFVLFMIPEIIDTRFCIWATICGSSCSKLTMSLVNDSLKFTSSDTQICWNFLLKKMWVAFALQKLLTFFQQKISEYCVLNQLKQLTKWPLTMSLS